MDTQPALTNHLVTKMQRALRTGGSSTIDVGHLYIQTAGYGEGMVMVETTSNEFLPRGHQLSGAAMGRLVELGFTEPDDDFPNWWIGLEDATDADIVTAASAVITALVEAYGLTPAAIALAFGVEPDHPRPVAAVAASEGKQVPDRAQLKRLKQRLALAESFCLEAVRTGIIPNTTAPHRMRELMEKQEAQAPDDPFLAVCGLDIVAGWEHVDRLRTAEEAIGAMYWSLSADTASEALSDEEDTWKALKQWLDVSPWRDA